jgi:hypothetical protein
VSYLARISARAAGSRSTVPAIVPKGLGNRHAPAIARMEEPGEEEETLAPMRLLGARPVRRQKAEGDSEEVLAAAREEEEPKAQRQTSEEEVAPLRRQEEEEEAIQPVRRQEEEDELATLRRQQEEEEEEAIQPIRRQEDEEEQAMPMRAIARQEEIPLEESPQPAPPPGQTDLEPDAEPVSQELAGEQEPSDLQALHRDISPGPELSPPALQGETPASRPLAEALTPFQTQAPDFPAGSAIPEMLPSTTRMDEARPTVVIDQLDVLIHEPVAQATRPAPRQDRDRALRARYLRRL